MCYVSGERQMKGDKTSWETSSFLRMGDETDFVLLFFSMTEFEESNHDDEPLGGAGKSPFPSSSASFCLHIWL